MGLGRYRNGKFDLVVVANYPMSAADRIQWERALRKASELLYDASQGQMQFGSIYACDENIGANSAEFLLHQTGATSYGTGGLVGTPGAALHLMPDVKLHPLTVLHEMGHHVWALGEEYTVAPMLDQIDKTSPAANRRTIPIVNSGRANNALTALNAKAILLFNSVVERRTITADTATSITVDSDFSNLPTNASSPLVQYQVSAECAAVANANYCIMERGGDAAGYFDGSGNWHGVAHPVTEFCTPVNHDPDSDTHQDDAYNKSCWEVIRQRAEFSTLTMPNPAAPGPATGWIVPSWIALEKQSRFALVLDRSGSMATGHKMADAQYGAQYWLQYSALGQDRLAVIWYDHAIDRILPLTQVSSLPSLQPTINAINALSPRGSTNIRDGLYEGLDQIQTPATRAAVQVAVLLTDGVHNTPWGSSAAEVIPDFNEAGIRIYALGVGAPLRVDMTTLDQLATATGGKSYAVGDNQPGLVQTALVQINAEVRGGIITTAPILFPQSMAGALDETIERFRSTHREEKRPLLVDLLAAMGLASPAAPGWRSNARVAAIPVEVEPHCERASFSLVFPATNRLWLYLLDPSGRPVSMTARGIHHRTGAAPHEFAVVENPAPGRWHIVAVRPVPGPAFSSHAIAGGENRNLEVFGGADPYIIKGPVRLWAHARWKHALSNLRVFALVRNPGGQTTRVVMHDSAADGDRSGIYEGYFNPLQPGRHEALIEIRGDSGSIIANPLHLVLHSQRNNLSLKVNVPRFVRRIPVTFDAGPRDDVNDTERAEGLVDRYQPLRRRPRKIESARSTKAAGKLGRARRRQKR